MLDKRVLRPGSASFITMPTQDAARYSYMEGSDGAGNLTAQHPAIAAAIKRDSQKFKQITDLKAQGLI